MHIPVHVCTTENRILKIQKVNFIHLDIPVYSTKCNREVSNMFPYQDISSVWRERERVYITIN